jgi:hypothetical protein
MSSTTSVREHEREIPERLFLMLNRVYKESNELMKLPHSDERARLLELIGLAYDAAIELWSKAPEPNRTPDSLVAGPWGEA